MDRRTSAIWNFFSNAGDYQATCKLCGGNKKFSYRTTLSNLGRHISRKHPHAMSGMKIYNFEKVKEEMVVDEMANKGEEKGLAVEEDSGEGGGYRNNASSEDRSQAKAAGKERPPHPNLLHHDYSRNPAESRKRRRNSLLAENALYRGVELRDPPTNPSAGGEECGSLLESSGRTLGWGSQTRDESDAYGEYVGHKLRKMDGRTRTLVQNQINNIFFEVDMTYYEARLRQAESREVYYESPRKEREEEETPAADPGWTASLVEEGTPPRVGEEEDVVIDSSCVLQEEDKTPAAFLRSSGGDESSGMVNGYVETS